MASQGSDQDGRDRIGSASCRPPITSTIPIASRPIATSSAASISSTALPMCRPYRQPANATPPRRASSSPSRSRKGRAIISAPSTFQSNVRAVGAESLRTGILRMGAGEIYNGEAIEKTVEDMTIELARRGYPFGTVRSARRSQPADANDQRRLQGGRRHARLYRAHQHPRQYPHARLRDPARVRRRRRRSVQPRLDRPRRAAHQEPRFLQDGENHQTSRARRPIAW